MDSSSGSQQHAIDPLSRQILERTNSQHRSPRAQVPPQQSNNYDGLANISRPNTHASTDYDDLVRSETIASQKQSRYKKNRVSFLSRFIGGKRKDEPSFDITPHDVANDRQAGDQADVFSQPFGYMPKFPAPPRYIRVKAQNRTRRDFDRLFLAQILNEGTSGRRGALEVDNKIHSIDDRPVAPPPNTSKTVNNAVWASGFSKDGQYFAAAGQDKKLKVWRIINREDREHDLANDAGNEADSNVKLNAPVFHKELVREYEGHAAPVLDLSWSKNNFLLSSSMDKTVRLYHISRAECLCSFKHNDFVTSIAWHPIDDRFFLAGSLDSRIRLWSVPDKSIAYSAFVSDMVTAVAFTPDGKTSIAGTLSGMCIIYDTDGLKAHSQIQVRSNRGKNAKGSKITGVETIAVPRSMGPPDVKILITSNDSRIRLYNLRDRALEVKFRGNVNTQSQIRASFSDDGRFVICGSEDKRVYIWPTGSIEKTDIDKRPVEVFEAHGSTVTTALFLPAQARRLLARSEDPIYDLCNPPPVQLLSKADSIYSSQAQSQRNLSTERSLNGREEKEEAESPEMTVRNSHNDGAIIVTADYSGEIRVFRQDCAYQKRRDSNWDTTSVRKMLGRSGSVITKNSNTSRRSTMVENRNPVDTSIIDWRNSVASAKPPSSITSATETRRSHAENSGSRSPSPGKKTNFMHRLSIRHGSTPLANTTRASSDHEQSRGNAPRHKSGDNPTSPTYKDHASRLDSTVTTQPQPPGFMLNDRELSNPPIDNDKLSKSAHDSSNSSTNDFVRAIDPQDETHGLYILGEQSYRAWDFKHKLVPLVRNQPRSPGGDMVKDGQAPLSREMSYVSQLSDERSSADATPGTEGGNVLQKEEAEDLKCRRCGSESFIMVKGVSGMSLRCKKCQEAV